MDDLRSYKKWKACRRFNKKCGLKEIRAILLLPWTKSFDPREDLARLLGKRFTLASFVSFCRQHRCYVMYFTLFTDGERRKYGSLADVTSRKICTGIVNKICAAHPRATVVSRVFSGIEASLVREPKAFLAELIRTS